MKRLLAVFLLGLLSAGVVSAQDEGELGPCGPINFNFIKAETCASYGLPAPCQVRCGRLCWRKGRKEWRWMQGANGCPDMRPEPTATPACAPPACRAWGTGQCLNPCPYQTPTPRPTTGRTPRPSPTSPCDNASSGWCWTWHPESDTVICARCSQ